MDRIDGLVSKFCVALKDYLKLQKEYALLELTEKLIRLLTVLVLGAILFVLGIIVVIFFALTIVALLQWLTGSAILSYGVVTLLLVSLGALIYINRGKWLVAPLTNLLISILLKENGK